MSGDRRTRRATEQELALWTAVNSDTVLSRVRETLKKPDNPQASPGPLPRISQMPVAEAPRPFARPPPPVLTGFTPKPPDVEKLRDITPGLDRRTARSLRRGERSPDARLDLHGMTADRAHSALNRFILDARSRGHRCVLVITGKGRRYTAPSESGFSMEHSEGVLRRDVPRWLGQAPLAGSIVGLYQAHRKHGGDGAFYVYLRKPR